MAVSLRLGSFQPRVVSRIAFAAFFWVTDNPAAISSAGTADRPSELHSPIREGGCTARFCVSDIRCGTYFIYSVYLQSRYSTGLGRVRGSILFPDFLAYRWPTNLINWEGCDGLVVKIQTESARALRPGRFRPPSVQHGVHRVARRILGRAGLFLQCSAGFYARGNGFL